jgi:hypothetical protein
MKTTLVSRTSSARGMVWRGLVAVAVAGMIGTQLQAQDPPATNMAVPAWIHQLKAHEVVERIIAQRHELLLSDAQFDELETLYRAVRDGRQVLEHESVGRTKPPYQRSVRITTPEQALAKAFSILTPQQQHASLMQFAKQGREQ